MKQIEKRIRKEIRVNKLIQKNNVLVISDALCEDTVKRIVKGMPITIKKRARKDKNEKKVLLWTLDDEIEYMTDCMFKGKQPTLLGHGKDVKLFITITNEELKRFAKLKKFSLPKTKKSKDFEKISKLIDKVEKKHPETRYSMYQSSIVLRNALKNKNK